MVLNAAKIEDVGLELFIQAMYLRYGYDFRQYAQASLKRRVRALTQAVGCEHTSQLLPKLLHEGDFLKFALSYLSVPVTEMFRDPKVFAALSQQVLPFLASFSRVNIWQAGCASGEESVSLAILLYEANLLHKTQIYATDINDDALSQAEAGIYESSVIELGQKNYREAGGSFNFKDYFIAENGLYKARDDLREKVSYAHHDLVSDGVFCEVSLVVCRNVFIYFNNALQKQVMSRFVDSLVRGGFLCLGSKESLLLNNGGEQFKTLDADCRIFKKKNNQQHPAYLRGVS